jgi:hypothetical protein
MPFGSLSACAAGQPSPNGVAAADAVTDVASHEITEAITDPFLNAWFDSSANEIGDLCAYNYGTNTWDGGLANERQLLRSAAAIRQSRRRLRTAWPLSRPDTPEHCHASWKHNAFKARTGFPLTRRLGTEGEFSCFVSWVRVMRPTTLAVRNQRQGHRAAFA